VTKIEKEFFVILAFSNLCFCHLINRKRARARQISEDRAFLSAVVHVGPTIASNWEFLISFMLCHVKKKLSVYCDIIMMDIFLDVLVRDGMNAQWIRVIFIRTLFLRGINETATLNGHRSRDFPK
jgi:hypothetical protein